MKAKRFFLVGVFVPLFLIGCQWERAPMTFSDTSKEQWLTPNFWIPDLAANLNFPNYFNASLLQKQKISKITEIIFSASYTDFLKVNLEKLSPDAIRTFEFDEKGNILSMEIQHFDQGKLNEQEKYIYAPKNDSYAGSFRFIRDFSSKTFFPINKKLSNDSRFVAFNLTKKADDYRIFTDTTTTSRWLVAENKKLLDPIALDTTFQPQPEDWIVFPSMNFPKKMYRVKNKIVEPEVYELHYGKSGQLVSYDYRLYSNHTERKFAFDKSGNLIGFTDRLLDADVFLREMHFYVQNDEKGRPKLIYDASKPADYTKRIIQLNYFSEN